MTLSKNKTKYIQSLKEKKYRLKHNAFVVEGDKSVSDLLPVMQCELLAGTPDFIAGIDKEHSRIKETVEISKAELERISFQKSPQQVLAVFEIPRFEFDVSVLNSQPVIALDGIRDPGNLGTIVRLADWYGIENVVCSEDTADAYNPKAVQAAMGALARVKVHYVPLEEWISRLKDIPVYGTFLDGENMYKADISANGVIVMGNEGNGIRPEIEKLIKRKLYIPSYPAERLTSESLNVAVATAVICSEFRRRML